MVDANFSVNRVHFDRFFSHLHLGSTFESNYSYLHFNPIIRICILD